MGVLYARETPNDTFEPVSTMGVGNASQSQRGLMTVPDKVKLDGITDYIVEQGTDGIWTYEKWNNGKVVCWGTYAATGISATAWGNQYSANIGAVNFPTGLFTTTPTVCLATPVAGYAGAICYNGTDGLTQNHTQGIQFVRPTTVSNASFTVGFYAIGKWK